MVVFEAVGLALGVAPLIIELLKANPGPLNALKATKTENAEKMTTDFYSDLQFEVSMLKLTLTRLVNDLPIKLELKEKLTNEKSLDPMVWKNPSPEVQSSLERRLNPCFDSFVQSMEKILQLLAKLVDDRSLPLPLTSDQIRVCTETPYAKLEEFFDSRFTVRKKLKFGWKKDKRDKLMKGMEKYNQRLEKMLSRTSKNGTGYNPPQRRTTTGFTPHLGLRQKMSDLRKAIGRAWCKCVGRHELRFGLSKTWKNEDHVRMDMIMNLSKDSKRWYWGECKISLHLKEGPYSRAINLPIDHSSSEEHRRSSSSFTGTTLVESPENSPRSEFLGTPPRNPSISVNDESVEEIKGSRKPSETHSGILVHNICTTVQKGQIVRRAPQLIFHEDMLWHNATTTDSEVHHSHPGVRLVDYLQRGKMNMKDRKILQVLLAQSVLFFPWAQNLNKNSISLHHDLNKPFATFVPDHGDNATKKLSDTSEFDVDKIEYKPYNNETLAALATTLLEIELEKPIEELQTDEDLGDSDSCNFVTNFWTTTRVLKEQKDNIYNSCYEAIDACLRCDFEDERSTLDDPNFLQQVYERIVAPLEQELSNGFSIRMPYLGLPDPEAESGVVALNIPQTSNVATRFSKSGQKKSVKISEDLPEEGEIPNRVL